MAHVVNRRDALGATAAAGLAFAAPALAQDAKPKYEFNVRDLVWSHVGGKPRLARLFQPRGDGPFPLVVQIHGGAWTGKDRTDGQNTALDFCAAGIAVLAIEFRNGNEAPYPASLSDINYGVRWAKAHATEFGSSADRVGLYGTSSGGHQALLSAMRPDDPRYREQELAEAPDMDAKVAFVVTGWGVMYPLVRRDLAKQRGDEGLVKSHATFFGNEETHLEATPALILERGEKVYLPPALVFQGDKDEWTSVELAKRLEADWKKAGGAMDLMLLDGEKHTFVNDNPFKPNSIKAVKAAIEFIQKYAGRG